MQTTAVVLSDTGGLIRGWNEGAERLFGWPAADALGQSLDLIVPEEFRDRHWAAFHRAMATGECRLDRATTNLPVRCRDGRVVVCPARFVFLPDAFGQAAGAVAIYRPARGGERPFGQPGE